jgi:hypothetical protein
MIFIDINNLEQADKIQELDEYIGNKNNSVFILIYMEGCGPCNATRPEWKKIKNVLKNSNLNDRNIVIASIDHISAEKLKHLKTQPNSFPTMRFITNGGETTENYEDSTIENKQRNIDSFVEWINYGANKNVEQTAGKKNKKTKKRNKNRRRKTMRKKRRY